MKPIIYFIMLGYRKCTLEEKMLLLKRGHELNGILSQKRVTVNKKKIKLSDNMSDVMSP